MKTRIFSLFAAMMLLFGAKAMAQTNGDVNEDGVVNEQDIEAVIKIMQEAGGIDGQYYYYVGQDPITADNYTTLAEVSNTLLKEKEYTTKRYDYTYVLVPNSVTSIRVKELSIGAYWSDDSYQIDSTISIPGHVVYKTTGRCGASATILFEFDYNYYYWYGIQDGTLANPSSPINASNYTTLAESSSELKESLKIDAQKGYAYVLVPNTVTEVKWFDLTAGVYSTMHFEVVDTSIPGHLVYMSEKPFSGGNARLDFTYGEYIVVTGITLDRTSVELTEGETTTLVATVAPDDATVKMVAWSTSDEAIATVDNGVVTAVAAGTATITAKAGDKSAACVVSVEKKAEEIVYAEIANGDYYLKNVGSGKFVTGANDWGTQASLGEYGLSITLERLPNGKYTLDTHVANNETDHYLGSNGYIDASAAEWIITEPKSGTYALTLDGISYWGYDGSGTVLANALTDPTQKNAQWQLVTRAELENALGKATLNNGVDATFYIQGHSFNRNHNENAAWMGEPVQGGPAHDMNAEKFNTTPLDIYQELSGMPNGYYVVEVQGFYRDNVDPNVTAERRAAGTEQLRASLYAGVYSIPLKSILDGATAEQLNGGIQTSYGWVPNSMDETASYFAQGLYINKVDAWVTDGTLRIGIRKETGEEGDWVIFDNFRLTYYGTKAPAGIDPSTLNSQPSTIYDLTGRKVTDTENLKGGIYIVNGKKMIIKD